MITEKEELPLSPSGTYDELAGRVGRAGLMELRTGYYLGRVVAALLLMAGCWVAFAMIGESWWQVVVAVALAGAFVQVGFIGHDLAHKQVTRSKRTADTLGILHMNVLMGAAYGWWETHHNRHHSNPNNLDKDPDTIRRQVIFDVDELPAKARTRWHRFVIRFQSVMFFVLLCQEAWRVHASGVRAARAGTLKRPVLELSLLALHFVLYFGAVFLVLSPLSAIGFILFNQAVFGLYLGAVFAPNHKGMPVFRDGVRLDWLHRQILTSRNIRSTYLTDYLYGGLNYQIEHHLFPSMPRGNLRHVRPIVREYCAQHGIPYYEVSMWQSYREVSGYLRKISDEAKALGVG